MGCRYRRVRFNRALVLCNRAHYGLFQIILSEKEVRSLTKIELWTGKNSAKVNGVDMPIDPDNPNVALEIINGRTMLSVRFIEENLGAIVE